MMTVESAFNRGMAELRRDGMDISGKDTASVAAFLVFERRAAAKQFHPRFSIDGPKYAKIVILEAHILAAGGRPE